MYIHVPQNILFTGSKTTMLELVDFQLGVVHFQGLLAPPVIFTAAWFTHQGNNITSHFYSFVVLCVSNDPGCQCPTEILPSTEWNSV